MKAILKKPNCKSELVEINDELEELRQLVGGYIETIPYRDNIIILLDEEGRLKDSEDNIVVSKYGMLVGNIVFVGTKGEDFISLTEYQIQEILISFSLLKLSIVSIII